MAAKHDQSKTKQQSSVANTTNNVTKTIADSMNTTLNYVTNVTNSGGAVTSGTSSMLPLIIGGGLGLLVLLMAFLRR
jgi:MYXO-CTERM domain-containing protein